MRTDSQDRRLCSAHTKAGTECRAPAIAGGLVCRMHGGSAPQVKDKARGVVLADLINPALLVLRDTLNDDKAPAAVKVRAALGILRQVRPHTTGPAQSSRGRSRHRCRSSPSRRPDEPVTSTVSRHDRPRTQPHPLDRFLTGSLGPGLTVLVFSEQPTA